MNWLEKVRYLKKLDAEGTYIDSEYSINIISAISTWKTGELESVIADYTYIPQSYIEFAKEFNNLEISSVGFFGSNGNLKEMLKIWSPVLGIEYFAFASDVDGSAFVINVQGEILRCQLGTTLDDEELEKFANSFEEFIDGCLLGKRYPDLYCGDLCYVQKDTFYQLLKHLSWA